MSKPVVWGGIAIGAAMLCLGTCGVLGYQKATEPSEYEKVLQKITVKNPIWEHVVIGVAPNGFVLLDADWAIVTREEAEQRIVTGVEVKITGHAREAWAERLEYTLTDDAGLIYRPTSHVRDTVMLDPEIPANFVIRFEVSLQSKNLKMGFRMLGSPSVQ